MRHAFAVSSTVDRFRFRLDNRHSTELLEASGETKSLGPQFCAGNLGSKGHLHRGCTTNVIDVTSFALGLFSLLKSGCLFPWGNEVVTRHACSTCRCFTTEYN